MAGVGDFKCVKKGICYCHGWCGCIWGLTNILTISVHTGVKMFYFLWETPLLINM